MAIIKFIIVSKGNLKNAVNYITRKDKTSEELIYCKNCDVKNIISEFRYIKELYKNTGGRQYYHFIQSFSPNDRIDPSLANKIGQEMCNYFKDYQVMMTTHIDKNYIHNHFIINSVNMETGKKYQQSKKDLEKIKILSNQLCKKYNLKQINLNNSVVSKYVKSGEYHLSKKEVTQKKKLIDTINKSIRKSKSKSQFIYMMNKLGYKVNWVSNRKYITYTTPQNTKFRDKRLGNVKYSKSNMDHYFEKVEKINKLNHIIDRSSSSQSKQIHSNRKTEFLNSELSKLAKIEYVKRQENASSIEWGDER